MSRTAALPAESAATGMFTSLLSHCVECGCNDMNACFDDAAGDACHWLEVDREARKGVCSACTGAMPRWRLGQREFAVPVDLDDR